MVAHITGKFPALVELTLDKAGLNKKCNERTVKVKWSAYARTTNLVPALRIAPQRM